MFLKRFFKEVFEWIKVIVFKKEHLSIEEDTATLACIHVNEMLNKHLNNQLEYSF